MSAFSLRKGENIKVIKQGRALSRLPFLFLIKFYQKTLSPDHGLPARFFPFGYCRFHPTCSEYTYQAIKLRGLFLGSILGLWRVLRCNPFSKGGVDEVPKKS